MMANAVVDNGSVGSGVNVGAGFEFGGRIDFVDRYLIKRSDGFVEVNDNSI